MKKAVIETGSKQYLVAVGDVIDVELLKEAKDTVSFDTLLVFDGSDVSVGAPHVSGAKVEAKVVEPDFRGEKVIAIRYKAKKRVKKVRGHRQHHTKLEITKIS
jgi:large subunit ribosomal protein L21